MCRTAGTIHSLQGAGLEHITVWLDVKKAKAAAYVAISRVQYDAACLLGGRVTRKHLRPAM